jgi:diamine N-acetyltransferase
MAYIIKEITSHEELLRSVPVIRESFKTVADEFKLTPGNCPSHPSFITIDRLFELKKTGIHLFGLFEDDLQAGFIAVEQSGGGRFFIEKLAVLPRCRHRGHGSGLMEHAFEFIRGKKGRVISIGIIDGHVVLKQWYKSFGFAETGTRRFDHLPFTVCFLEKAL